jgi:dinuclear metal center YbgI/SA1388 family protein
MDALAPPRLAQEWDNVGLLVGDRRAACRRVLLCIDTTPAVLAEARRLRCPLIISYHPVIFRPVKTIRADSDGTDSLVHEAIRLGIAIYSPHTALDAAGGGTNDVLAELCGLRDVGPFEFVAGGPRECKVVVFVPPDALDRVANAMFTAGAGRIGEYEQCSYRLRGEGTFFGTEATNPAVGKKGRLERVEEIRLEIVAPQNRIPEIVQAIRASHPYETPAYDIYPLESPPTKGIGRVGTLPPGTTPAALARTLKRRLKSPVVQLVGDPKGRVRRAAVCAGAAGRLPLEHPRSADADVIVTGEIRHHDALAFLRLGKCAIALGHWESERPVLPRLAERLKTAVAGLNPVVSRADTGPLRFM